MKKFTSPFIFAILFLAASFLARSCLIKRYNTAVVGTPISIPKTPFHLPPKRLEVDLEKLLDLYHLGY